MYFLRILLILIWISMSAGLQAQGISEQHVKQYFPKKLRSISKKLYLAGMNGKIKTYFSDSLQSLRTREDIELRGATWHVFQKQVGPDAEDVIDTMFWTPFHLDSIFTDMMIAYQVKEGFNDLSFSPKAISPILMRSINGIKIAVNLFWIDWNELEKALGPGDVFFLNKYAKWKHFEVIHGLRNHNDSLQDIWDQWQGNNLEPVYNLNGSHDLGPMLINRFKSVVLANILASNIELNNEKAGRTTAEEFKRKHRKKFVLPYTVLVDGVSDETVDTIIYALPVNIDSISFEYYHPGMRKYFIHQKPEGSTVYTTYYLLEKDVKLLFSDEYWYMLQLALQD